MVRWRCGLAELDDEATTRARVAETLERYMPGIGERELGRARPAGAPRRRRGSRVRLRAAVPGMAHVLREHRSRRHRGDGLRGPPVGDSGSSPSSTTWPAGARTSRSSSSTMARPELLEAHPDWGTGHRGFTSMALGPLEVQAMRELLAGLVPGLPARGHRAHRRPRRRHPAVRGRDRSDAPGRRSARPRGRRLPSRRGPLRAGGARDPPVADRVAPGRP